jgi:hypothetical protein
MSLPKVSWYWRKTRIHVLGFGDFGKPREAAQVAVKRGNFPPVAFQKLFAAGRQNDLRDLW